MADYKDFNKNMYVDWQGIEITWANILPVDAERVCAEIAKHADAYERHGYRVERIVDDGMANAKLVVQFKNTARITNADIEQLEAAAAGTMVKAGWGGSG